MRSSIFLRTFENAVAKESLPKVFSYGVEITKEIVAEILANMSDLLQEISLHDEHHRVNLLNKIMFTFISMKGKHLCRNINLEKVALIRHKNTKQILFKHE